jgi:hypothetical protein
VSTARNVYHVARIEPHWSGEGWVALYRCDRNGKPWQGANWKGFATEAEARAWAAEHAPGGPA